MALIRGLFFTNSTAITRALRAGTTLSPISDASSVLCATCFHEADAKAGDEGRSLPLMMMEEARATCEDEAGGSTESRMPAQGVVERV